MSGERVRFVRATTADGWWLSIDQQGRVVEHVGTPTIPNARPLWVERKDTP